MSSRMQAVVIGASAGGLRSLCAILPGLPSDYSLAVVVAQHHGDEPESTLSEILGRVGALPSKEAEDKDAVLAGTVYTAPPSYHLLIERERRFGLCAGPRVRHSRPCIDVLFESAADAYGDALVGVVLSGANDDGSRGLRAIRDRGGLAVVQDPACAEASPMPSAALAAVEDAHVLGLDEITRFLSRLHGVAAS